MNNFQINLYILPWEIFEVFPEKETLYLFKLEETTYSIG